MQGRTHPGASDWRQAAEAGLLDLWDLRFVQETVHHSPAWKQRLGFPDPQAADSTHFWRCRVHPADLDGMLAAMRAHLRGEQPGYDAVFRLRSNGSGYRRLHSRGRVIERGPDGQALRMVGGMVDLTERPCTPRGGLAEGERGPMAGSPMTLPFHELMTAAAASPPLAAERQRLIGLVGDLLRASLAELAGLPAL